MLQQFNARFEEVAGQRDESLARCLQLEEKVRVSEEEIADLRERVRSHCFFMNSFLVHLFF